MKRLRKSEWTLQTTQELILIILANMMSKYGVKRNKLMSQQELRLADAQSAKSLWMLQYMNEVFECTEQHWQGRKRHTETPQILLRAVFVCSTASYFQRALVLFLDGQRALLCDNCPQGHVTILRIQRALITCRQ